MQIGGLSASGVDVSRPFPASKTGNGTVGDSHNTPPDPGDPIVVTLNSDTGRKVRFEYDFSEQEVYVQVVDGDTGEVLRQIPDQEYRQLIGRLQTLLDTYVTGSE